MTDFAPHHQLVAALRKCREQFAFYGKNHRTKAEGLRHKLGFTTDPAARENISEAAEDTDRKAAVNEQMAAQIDALIGAPGTGKAPDDLAANPCKCIDCGGTEPSHSSGCTYMASEFGDQAS